MNIKWKLLLNIFISFLKIGPSTFGGGYAMIPLIEREVVEKRKWVKTEDVSDVFAVAESVPGAIAINSATFIGFRIAGPLGAVVAMCGVMLPTFLIVLVLSITLLTFQDHPIVTAAFEGIRPAIVALIVFAGYKIGKVAILDKTTSVLVALALGALLFFPVHPILVIISGGILGVLLVKVQEKLGKR